VSELPIDQVVTGDCREVMAEWPEDCIDFVMFSPPYWGLRDYGEEAASIWGSDGNCEHEWVSEEAYHDNLRFRDPNEKASVGTDKNPEVYSEPEQEQAFCRRCGAWKGQLGLEPDYRMYVQHLVEVGREIKRILKPSGSWYLNLGDTYSTHASKRSGQFGKEIKEGFDDVFTRKKPDTGLPEKCKMLMPYRVAPALIDDGWICRNDIIWLKPNPMPSSVKDRLNTTTERIFHFVQEKQYYYDLDAIREPHQQPNTLTKTRTSITRQNKPSKRAEKHKLQAHPKGKNPGDVIEQTTQPFPEAHFAVYPPDLCEKPIKSSCPPKVCSKCGKPHERGVERSKVERERPNSETDRHKAGGGIDAVPNDYAGVSVKHKGWKKTCNCPTDKTKPGIVLDPMCGAGSTLIKAEQLGRRYIGIEISDEYAEIARERLEKGDERYKRRKRKERRLEKQAKDSKKLEAFC